jgi:hypothetical protein
MAGQGSLPVRRGRLRAAWYACAPLLLLCLIGTRTVQAEEVDLHLRASWGGGGAAAWSGAISISAGTIAIENVLGIEADSAGVLTPESERTLRIVPRAPRTYDGFDLVVRAPREATLHLEFASTANAPKPVSMEVPLEKLVSGRFIQEIDATGNRFAVHRTAGDSLRFRTERTNLVFDVVEHLQAEFIPHLIESGKGTTAKYSLRLVSLPSRATVWQNDEEVALDETGSAPPIPLDVVMPEDEGVYELVAELHPKWFGAPLVRGKPLAERQVQVVVVRPKRIDAAGKDWASVGEFDPAQPKLWERVLRLPGIKIVPGLSKGPLGSEPTGTREHLGTTWSTLKPGAWQAYPLPVGEVGLPHLLEVEFPSDVPESLAISIVEPNAAGQVTPLGLDSGVDVVSTPGRPPQTLRHRLAFWPRTKSPVVLLANRRSDDPVLFGKIRVLAGPMQLSPPSSRRDIPAQRLVGVYFDKPQFCENFSAAETLDSRSTRLIDDWSMFLQGSSRLADYVRWSGHNAAVVNVLSDGSSLYPSELIGATTKYDMGAFSSLGNDPLRKDVLEMLLKVFDREQLRFVPALSFTTPLPELERILAASSPQEAAGIELIGHDGRRWIDANHPRRGNAPYYNLLDERVQLALRRTVAELVQRYASHPSLGGVALQLTGESYAQLPDEACGLDDVTLARFARDCQLALPDDDPERPTLRWEWIQREARAKWLQWRTQQVTSFYRSLVEDIRAAQPELQLLLCPTQPLQARRLAARIRPTLPIQERVTDALLQVGLDSNQLRQIPGLTLVRCRDVEPSTLAGSDPLRSELNGSIVLDREAASFASPAVLQFHAPLPLRLEAFDKVSPFGPQNTQMFMLSHLSPVGLEARARFIRSLASADVHVLLDGGQMLALGQEDSTRDLLLTLAEIPPVRFEDVPASMDDSRTQPVTLRRRSDGADTWFYLVNDSPWPVLADVDLVSSTALAIQTFGPLGQATKLSPAGGQLHWKMKLQPYDLVAARIAAADVKVASWRTQVDPGVDAALREQLRDIRLRANLLRSPAPMTSLANGSFESAEMKASPGDSKKQVPGWSAATGAGITVEVDHRTAKEGASSLHVISRPPRVGAAGPVVWIRSDAIPTPTTGRLAIWVWLKTPDPRRQPKLRLAIEGRLDGQPYYRRANVGESEDGRPTQPLQQDWSPFLFPVDDLPVRGLTDLQIGLDLMDEGEVWIDQAQVFDLWFQEVERDSLLKSIALADFQVQEGKLGDALRFVEGYWPQFLRRHMPVENASVASIPQRTGAPASPAATTTPTQPAAEKKAGTFDGVKRWLPRLPFQK